MVQIADSEIARRTARRRTANGWLTSFIGANRHTRAAGDPPPPPDVLYPMAFLVEKDAGAVVAPHFHQADQFQVVTQGDGTLGRHAVGGAAVHYTDSYSAYGPILAGEGGLAWFTLRNAWDPGARYMPAARAELRAGRGAGPGARAHHEATVPAAAVCTAEVLAQLPAPDLTPILIPEQAGGAAAWRARLGPGMPLRGPDPAAGRGQFWIVLAGGVVAADGAALGPMSVLFVAPDEAPLTLGGGAEGAEALCLQFPARPAAA